MVHIPENGIVRAGRLADFKHEREFTVNWLISNLCDFRCSYCVEVGQYNGVLVSLEDMKRAVDSIAALDRDRIRFTLTGGEPTIHPNFISLVEYIFERCGERAFVHIMTNLNRPLEFYERFVERLGQYRGAIDFDASVHCEFADMGRFLENARLLGGAGFPVVAYVLAHPRYMPLVKRYQALLEKMQGTGIVVNRPKIVIFSHEPGPEDHFSEADMEWLGLTGGGSGADLKQFFVDRLERRGEELLIHREMMDRNSMMARGLNSFKGLLCNAGVDAIAIDQEGYVDRAVCFRNQVDRALNIYRDDVAEHLGQPVECPFLNCFCGSDIVLPKYLTPELFQAACEENR